MVDLLAHPVRFGEVAGGPYVHWSRVFDWLIRATEELSHVLCEPAEATVAAGGVPFAPVGLTVTLPRYPRYGDTVVVAGRPTAAGESAVEVDYRLRRADGGEFGRATLVHVTMTPEHAAAPVSAALRERLAAIGDVDGTPTRVDPAGPAGEGPTFRREFTIRTPHLEAAGLTYFEDYAREMSMALEAFLEARGAPLSARSDAATTDERAPFLPVAWTLAIDRPMALDDRIAVVGRVGAVAEDAVEVGYAFRGADAGETRLRADVTYGCLDDANERVPFPAPALAAVRRD